MYLTSIRDKNLIKSVPPSAGGGQWGMKSY